MTDWWFRERMRRTEWEGQVTKEQEGREWNFLPASHSFSSFSFLSFFQITQDSLSFPNIKQVVKKKKIIHGDSIWKQMRRGWLSKKERQRKGKKWEGPRIFELEQTSTLKQTLKQSLLFIRRVSMKEESGWCCEKEQMKWVFKKRIKWSVSWPEGCFSGDSFYKKRRTLVWSSVREKVLQKELPVFSLTPVYASSLCSRLSPCFVPAEKFWDRSLEWIFQTLMSFGLSRFEVPLEENPRLYSSMTTRLFSWIFLHWESEYTWKTRVNICSWFRFCFARVTLCPSPFSSKHPSLPSFHAWRARVGRTSCGQHLLIFFILREFSC